MKRILEWLVLAIVYLIDALVILAIVALCAAFWSSWPGN